MKKLMTVALIFVAAFIVSVVIVNAINIVNNFISDAKPRVRDYFAELLQR